MPIDTRQVHPCATDVTERILSYILGKTIEFHMGRRDIDIAHGLWNVRHDRVLGVHDNLCIFSNRRCCRVLCTCVHSVAFEHVERILT